MKKINIIKNSSRYDQIIKNGKQKTGKYLYVYSDTSTEKNYKFGICVSTKIGNAVVRNKIKRQIKDIVDKFQDKDIIGEYVVIVNKRILSASYLDIKEDLIKLINEIGR